MVADRPEQPPDRVRHPLVAYLLPGDGEHIVALLDAVVLLARAWCPSCVAVSLTVDHEGQPVTVTVTLNTGHRYAPSMTVRLPRPSLNGPARSPAVLVVFATDAFALARLAVDLTASLDIDRRRITLAADAPVPPPTTAGLVLAGQLADRAAVDRALEALLEQGWTPTAGRKELQRRADDAGDSLVQAAAKVFVAPARATPQRPS